MISIITPKINETTATAFTNLGFVLIAKCFSIAPKTKTSSKNNKNFSVQIPPYLQADNPPENLCFPYILHF